MASLDANLGALLRMECGEFWRHIAHDVSIARALDTYLRYRRRPYDDGAVCAVAPPTTTNDDDDDEVRTPNAERRTPRRTSDAK